MKKWAFFTIGFCFCALVFGALTWKLNTSSGSTKTEEYHQKIRNGLAEINIPRNKNSHSINAAPDSLSNFIYHRSGLKISKSNKSTLRFAEQNAWNDSKRVDAASLTRIITDIALEKISTLSDSEIADITDSLRGFNAPGLPEGYQKGQRVVKLRASGSVQMPADEFSLELTKLRDGGIQGMVARNLIHVSVASEVNRYVDTIRRADPQFFGGTQSSMTPTQALLIVYAVVADDPLTHKQAELAQEMQNRRQFRFRVAGSNFPSPNGHNAYGDNGYLYSSPAKLLLDDTSVERLLTLIQERGN